MDACIQQLFTRLEELGVAEDTIIVLTGDHGESLYEHDCYFDHHGLYEANLHVPVREAVELYAELLGRAA